MNFDINIGIQGRGFQAELYKAPTRRGTPLHTQKDTGIPKQYLKLRTRLPAKATLPTVGGTPQYQSYLQTGAYRAALGRSTAFDEGVGDD
jgi:hypothetical protein